jgi:transcriptional regulator with XRE-family HTH domain
MLYIVYNRATKKQEGKMAAKMFGVLFKELRLKKGYTLREYCRTFCQDPAYISRLERGKIPPPSSEKKLIEFALSLDIGRESEEWRNFFSIAMVSAGKIPNEIMSDEEVLKHVPIFLRTLKGEKLTEEQLDSLIEIIKRA